jgi:hypothetical protein
MGPRLCATHRLISMADRLFNPATHGCRWLAGQAEGGRGTTAHVYTVYVSVVGSHGRVLCHRNSTHR